MSDIIDYKGYPEPIIDFASYKITMNFSVKTVMEYMLDLRTFSRFLVASKNGTLKDNEKFEQTLIENLDWKFYNDVSENEVYQFISYVGNGRNNSESAKSRKLSAIKSFYKYATVKSKKIENNPAKNIESPKKKKQLPKHLSVDESIDLLSAVLNDKTNKYRERDYCILTLFLNCGMRLSELCNISLNDIDRDLVSLRVVGKGSKERIVYLNSACKKAIIDYLKVRNNNISNINNADNALFISRIGRRISNKTVQWMVKKYLAQAGLEYKHYSTHKLRHTAATLMYQTGDVDIRVLKDILGHEQLNTTQIYTHVSDSGMQAAVEHNPLANIKIAKLNEEDK